MLQGAVCCVCSLCAAGVHVLLLLEQKNEYRNKFNTILRPQAYKFYYLPGAPRTKGCDDNKFHTRRTGLGLAGGLTTKIRLAIYVTSIKSYKIIQNTSHSSTTLRMHDDQQRMNNLTLSKRYLYSASIRSLLLKAKSAISS